ncbi:hypothetical protein GQ457_13G013930 [Hibiscus cannabinus]
MPTRGWTEDHQSSLTLPPQGDFNLEHAEGRKRQKSLTLWRQEGKEDQGITFVQVRFYGYGSMYKQWGGSVFCIFGLEYRYSSMVSVPEFNTGIRVSVLLDEYRYPNSTLESVYRYSGTRISTPLEISLVSIHWKEYRYPSSLMELEYRFGIARPRRGVRGGGQAPIYLYEVEVEQSNEETLSPLPPVGEEANKGARFSAYLVSSIDTLQWYRYPNSTLESAYRYC